MGFRNNTNTLSSRRNMLFVHMFIIKTLNDNEDSLVMNDGDLVVCLPSCGKTTLMYNYELLNKLNLYRTLYHKDSNELYINSKITALMLQNSSNDFNFSCKCLFLWFATYESEECFIC